MKGGGGCLVLEGLYVYWVAGHVCEVLAGVDGVFYEHHILIGGHQPALRAVWEALVLCCWYGLNFSYCSGVRSVMSLLMCFTSGEVTIPEAQASPSL